MKTAIEDILHNKLSRDVRVSGVEKLHGDASYRTYSRVGLSDGSTLIAMQMPAGASSASEEITNFEGVHAELPFVNVARFLSSRGLPVPRIEYYDDERHLMLIEDLGDGLMARIVERPDDETRRFWYRKAIDLLVEMQEKTSGASPDECVALQRSFDQTLFDWEFDHFLEYGIEARTGTSPSSEDRASFFELTRRLGRQICRLPRSFTHRDFQSRNLVVRDGSLVIIDFQDALMGPQVYDLVALLRDSYVRLSDSLLGNLLVYYAEKVSRPADEIRREFDIVTVQRKLKDAGRFVFIDRVKGNPNFLKYIPTSLGYARAALERMPDEARLYRLLKKFVPEWGRT